MNIFDNLSYSFVSIKLTCKELTFVKWKSPFAEHCISLSRSLFPSFSIFRFLCLFPLSLSTFSLLSIFPFLSFSIYLSSFLITFFYLFFTLYLSSSFLFLSPPSALSTRHLTSDDLHSFILALSFSKVIVITF